MILSKLLKMFLRHKYNILFLGFTLAVRIARTGFTEGASGSCKLRQRALRSKFIDLLPIREMFN